MLDTAAAAPPAASTLPSAITLAALPAIGQPLAGGIFAGITTLPDGSHHAVALLPDQPAKRLKWAAAVKWAQGLGDGAQLPAQPVSALLFANAREHVEADWYWNSEAFDGSYAWSQGFTNGNQRSTPKSFEGRARAVRLIHLVP